MRTAIAVSAAFLIAAAPMQETAAKPRGCFTHAEQVAEQVVRFGLRLREGGTGCDGDPWNAGTLPLWQAVDQQFGPQFRQQTDVRRKAFEREFENDAENKLSYWNARIVFYYRHLPLSPAYCASVKATLAGLPGKPWNNIVKQAAYGRDDIRMTYQPCD